MGIRITCDVEGCDNSEDMTALGDMPPDYPLRPLGWTTVERAEMDMAQLHKTAVMLRASEQIGGVYEKATGEDIAMSLAQTMPLPEGPAVKTVSGVICPRHELPKLRGFLSVETLDGPGEG